MNIVVIIAFIIHTPHGTHHSIENSGKASLLGLYNIIISSKRIILHKSK